MAEPKVFDKLVELETTVLREVKFEIGTVSIELLRLSQVDER